MRNFNAVAVSNTCTSVAITLVDAHGGRPGEVARKPGHLAAFVGQALQEPALSPTPETTSSITGKHPRRRSRGAPKQSPGIAGALDCRLDGVTSSSAGTGR
ncbi:hypothetical protein [Stenotrophomonas sp. NLF4-10]|uniref:hypothetical protein n=1 Tax=Stenotrophomonas sp. NLF4-10 TaxID=2918754 RepID=UPI001EFC178E|nr:hypothetical protein [Stenotrophomonas sp. NLF4-10]MCG8275527.1 hypothetical protein [Stenotrophomonas sp. NLF4-10]